MSDALSSDKPASLQITTIFAFMDFDYIQTVVKRAIHSRSKVSKEAQGMFKSAVNDTVKVSQFPNKPANAPPPFLIEPVLKAVIHSDKLAGAVLKVWAESHEVLGDVVAKHLGNLAMPAEYPDFSQNQFRGSWFRDVWTRERDKVLECHGEFDKDDVALMLCYISGKIPGSRENKSSEILLQTLEYLRSLPANAPEWEQGVPKFVETLNALRDLKEAQRNLAIKLDAEIAEIAEMFSSELAFFQRDAASWSVAHLSPDADILEALDLIKELHALLVAYRPVHEMAPVLSEERARRQKRAKLEDRVLPVLSRIDQLMCGTPAEERQPTGEVPGETPQKTQAPDDAGQADERRSFSDEDYESLQSENQHLNREVKSLQSKLHKTRNEVESWRVAYIEAASKEPASADEDENSSIENVQDAVGLAKEKYDDRLLFQLNAKSRVEDNPFKHPKAVWDALEWLATTYYQYRMGERDLSNIDQSIREACKWWYRGHQSNMTMNKYKDWYTTKVNDQIFWLHTHIGTGSNKNARYTIRIGFDWDKNTSRVVIGFIGQHQQTDAT